MSFVTAGLSHKRCLTQLQTMLDRLHAVDVDDRDTVLELEARCSPLTHDEFTRILAHAPTRPQFTEKILDVYFHAPGEVLLRARVRDEARIKRVIDDIRSLSTEEVGASLLEKHRISQMSMSDDARFVLSSERKVAWTDEISQAASQGRKAFRMKHVFSYPLASGKARVDMMIVRSSPHVNSTFCAHTNLASSGILESPEVYECELEFLPPSDAGHAPLQDAGRVVDIVSKLFVSKLSVEDAALWTYLQCTHPNADIMPCLHEARTAPHRFILAPQPAALKRHHILPRSEDDRVNVPNIYEDPYTVTVKLDGQRCFLVGDTKGQLYMLDSNLNLVVVLACSPAGASLVCEGELMDDTLHLFDVYFKGRTDYRNMPFFESTPSRYETLKDLVDEISRGSTAKKSIVTKEFWMCTPDNVAKALAECEDLATDGLVFTPCDMPVDGLWARILKWKPTHTVDFKVVHDDANDATFLHVGDMETVSLLKHTVTQYSERPKYTHVPFPHHNPLRPRLKVLKDGTVVPTNCVVECEWDPVVKTWTPVRLRRDKARFDKIKGKIVCRPNDMHTALDTWECITEDLKADDLVRPAGETITQPNRTIGEDPYYASTQERSKLMISGMLHFHNDGVKNKKLILPLAQRAKTVLDIACGRGGDLFKWLKKVPYKFYVGLDVCRWNISDPNTGACSRACKLPPAARKHVYFLCADASHPIGPDCGKDDDSLKISRHLWGQQRLVNVPRDFGGCVQGFDAVSCQFALHYFFQSERSLITFIDNVVDHMRPGAHFVGTCLDGDAVHEVMKNTDFGGVVKGLGPNNRIMWSIRKKYRNDDAMLGRRVGVFLESTGQVIDEFLVDFEYLVYEMQERGVVIEDTGLFGEVHDNASYPMSESERRLSYMNRYFVFRK